VGVAEAMKIPKSCIGKLAVVKFLDHAAQSKDVVICHAVGWIESVGTKKITLIWWDLESSDAEEREINREHFSLVISAIKSIEIYEKPSKLLG
jgi:hypothetical protein